MPEDTTEAAVNPKVEADRQLLKDAHARGTGATVGAFIKLSGPGWLQSAITLGGGSLSGALFLGVLGGFSMLWLQLLAITMGVIMLSAISYVTLSTGKKPFQAINEHINPALGWSWAIATAMANMIWCMPQFSLSFGALNKNITGDGLGESLGAKLGISAVLFTAALGVVILNGQGGKAAKVFDWFLKALVGMVVICFFGVVMVLATQVGLPWGQILSGFIPDLSQWNQPAGELTGLLGETAETYRAFWSDLIVTQQRDVMIAAAATAVGINMTFLLPYSMLNRGWDKPFRGLARFDLSTGMAIPYILVTSCVVIASASQFHGKADEAFLSTDPAVMQTSPIYGAGSKSLIKRMEHVEGEAFKAMTDDQKLAAVAALPATEKQLAAALVKRNEYQLSQSLAPLLGPKVANFVFGLGVLGMGFSTIIILMLINGYVTCEMLGKPQGGTTHIVGCIIAGLVGALWPIVWDGDAKLWLAILTSTFGMMLLPIAYITFFFMMNSKSLMGAEKPTGGRLIAWNVLMGVSVLGAIVAAGSAVMQKLGDPVAGPVVLTLLIVFVLAVIAGFFLKKKPVGS